MHVAIRVASLFSCLCIFTKQQLMSPLRRKFFVVLLFLSLLVSSCMWYSVSNVSRLSVVSTVQSYVCASILQREEINDLNELQQMKAELKTLIEKYSEAHPWSTVTSSSLTDELSPAVKTTSHQPSITENSYNDHDTSSSQNKLMNTLPEEMASTLSSDSKKETYSTTTKYSFKNSFDQEVVSSKPNGQKSVSINDSEVAFQHQETEDLRGKNSGTDQLLHTLLLQALMNGTTDNKPRLLLTEPTIPPTTGCKNTGNFPSEESKNNWLNFKSTLETYADFHNKQVQKLKAGDSTVRTLTWSCSNPVKCAGIGDQFYRIQEALVFAIAFKRVLSLHWNPASYETMKYLQPNKIDWTYFNRSQGMHEYHDAELWNIKVMDTAKEFEPLYNILVGENHTHVTVNYELQVPFLRGMTKAIRTNPGMRKELQECGFAALITDRKKRVPMNFLSGKLLRYLFHFEDYVINKVDRIQSQLGITDKPYLAVHMRTGFLGMKQEEDGKFNSDKIYRNPEDWDKTLTCSLDLAERIFEKGTPIFLATDSSKVKELAADKYGTRIAMINVTLQHVAFSEAKESGTTKREENRAFKYLSGSDLIPDPTERTGPILNVDGVNGYMATWIEFLLLARASAMVHSISGFSSTASYYCSMQKQYHVPNCSK